MKYKLGYPVIDLHVHLRNDIPYHTKILKDNGVDVVVYMPNSIPPLDNAETIEDSLKPTRYCQAIPVGAVTKNREGKELVDVEENRKLVVGFSDDGNCIEDFGILREMHEMNTLVMPHCSPAYDIALADPMLQIRYLEKCINNFLKVGKGYLHIQHVSREQEIDLIREAKKSTTGLTCETCPHYVMWYYGQMDKKVNPPLARKADVETTKEGLADGTIDAIASDYAPLPRVTGFAIPDLFIPISRGLILQGILTEEQLKEKLFVNPKRIIESSGYKLTI